MRTAVLILAALPLCAADWNPRLAADYLDGRQKEWLAWPTAAAPGGQCISCHTNMTYLLARPALRKALGESRPTEYETALLASLRARAGKTDPGDITHSFKKEPAASQAVGVEAILAALFLPRDPVGSEVFDRLMRLQIQEGSAAGAWPWFQLDLDPWETTASPFYGAALAAVALDSTPAEYRERPDVQKHSAALAAYLKGAQASQPLHNRLMLLWSACPAPLRRQLVDEALGRQQPDGGWTLDSLGPWKERPTAVPSSGSQAYATAMVVVSLEHAGLSASDRPVAKALEWLKSQQNPRTGYWDAMSMNKRYPAGSMQEQFMRDAATALASLALVSGGAPPPADRLR